MFLSLSYSLLGHVSLTSCLLFQARSEPLVSLSTPPTSWCPGTSLRPSTVTQRAGPSPWCGGSRTAGLWGLKLATEWCCLPAASSSSGSSTARRSRTAGCTGARLATRRGSCVARTLPSASQVSEVVVHTSPALFSSQCELFILLFP